MNSLATGIMIAVISIIALETIIYWHRKTKGTWRQHPAGRSLMYLLAIIGVGFGYGVVNRWLGDYPGRVLIGFAMYLLFISALIVIRVTITKEIRAGRKKMQSRYPMHTGPVIVAVASKIEEKEESDDD